MGPGAALTPGPSPFTWDMYRHATCSSWWENNYWPEDALSPQHEKLFSLMCVLARFAPNARRVRPDTLLLMLGRVHDTVSLAMLDAGTHARVSLRVRSAMEEIVRCTNNTPMHYDVYKALERVLAAARWGTEKSKLLTMVTDKTWLEQCAGRAALAVKRGDFPELSFD